VIPSVARPEPQPVPITLSRLLLTEGVSPMHFCEAILRHIDLAPQVEVRSFGGNTDLATILKAFAESSEFKALVTSVGIIRDAEGDAVAARRLVDAAIENANLPDHVRRSVFILPDNVSPGMIETLCMDAVRQHAPLAEAYNCVQSFFTCLQESGVFVPHPVRGAKNRAQAFLATKADAQMFPGIAAYRGFWPWDSPTFDTLKQFLRSL